jgi:hypothetical protein
VRKQPNGLLTIVVADKDGNTTEITDNDHVSAGWTDCDSCSVIHLSR